MINKLSLIGSGNNEDRFFYIFNKDECFFSQFPLFLLSLGFRDLGNYEDEYVDEKPNFGNWKNHLENFKNEEYDLDLFVTREKIFFIIRTDVKNREKLISAIDKISNQ